MSDLDTLARELVEAGLRLPVLRIATGPHKRERAELTGDGRYIFWDGDGWAVADPTPLPDITDGPTSGAMLEELERRLGPGHRLIMGRARDFDAPGHPFRWQIGDCVGDFFGEAVGRALLEVLRADREVSRG